VTKILYHWILLLDQFRFCETHFTTYQRFVADQSAISPFLGGVSLSSCLSSCLLRCVPSCLSSCLSSSPAQEWTNRTLVDHERSDV